MTFVTIALVIVFDLLTYICPLGLSKLYRYILEKILVDNPMSQCHK